MRQPYEPAPSAMAGQKGVRIVKIQQRLRDDDQKLIACRRYFDFFFSLLEPLVQVHSTKGLIVIVRLQVGLNHAQHCFRVVAVKRGERLTVYPLTIARQQRACQRTQYCFAK